MATSTCSAKTARLGVLPARRVAVRPGVERTSYVADLAVGRMMEG